MTRSAPQFDPKEGLIHLDVTVTDAAGAAVKGLELKNFTLLDNGQAQKVITFQSFDGASSGLDAATEIILVIDELDLSALEIVAAEREA